MPDKIQNVPPADMRIVGAWTITGGDYPLTDVYRADGTVVQYVAGQIIQPRRFEIDGEFLTCFVEQKDGRIFEQKARFGISGDTLTFYDSPTNKRVFRRLQAA
jgi:hypothetical protein